MDEIRKVIYKELHYAYQVVYQDLAKEFCWEYIPFSKAPPQQDEIIIRACEYTIIYSFIRKKEDPDIPSIVLQDEGIRKFIRYYSNS